MIRLQAPIAAFLLLGVARVGSALAQDPAPPPSPTPSAAPVSPQEGARSCELIRNQWVYIRVLGDNSRNSYVSGPLEVRCDGGVRIQADSAVIYEASGYTQLFGNVMFEDPQKRLTSERANYFDNDRRLVALGDGRVVDKVRQSVITGDTVVYARARPPFRPDDLLNVRGNEPHAILFPPEPRSEPVDSAIPRVVDPASDSSTVADTVAAATPPDTATTDPAADSAGSAALGDAPADSSASPSAPVTPVEPDTVAGAPGGLRDPTRAPLPPAASARRTPYEIDADHFSIVADRQFLGDGNVVITRDSLEAFGDSLRYDQDLGDVVLTGNARIEEASFDLVGDEVRLTERPGGEQEVRAVGNAVLVADQVDLTAPEIRIFLDDGSLDHLVAVKEAAVDGEAITAPGERPRGLQPATAGPVPPSAAEPAVADSAADVTVPQPRALTEEFVLTGDSIEVIAPGEVLRTVTAVGAARGESTARDSLNSEATPDVARRDWLEGQTIIAYFVGVDSAGRREEPDSADSPARPDTSAVAPSVGAGESDAGVRLDRIVAQGSARSLYRMTPSDSAGVTEPGRLAIHYVSGDEIILTLRGRALDAMEVKGSARGFHLEPLALPAAPSPDSLAVDSLSAADSASTSDTASVADTAGAEPREPDTPRPRALAGTGRSPGPSATRDPRQAPWAGRRGRQ